MSMAIPILVAMSCSSIVRDLIVRVSIVVAVTILLVVVRSAVMVAIAFGVFSGFVALTRRVFSWLSTGKEESGHEEGKDRAFHMFSFLGFMVVQLSLPPFVALMRCFQRTYHFR